VSSQQYTVQPLLKFWKTFTSHLRHPHPFGSWICLRLQTKFEKSGEPTKLGPLERVFLIRPIYSSLSPFQVMTEKDSANEMLWFFLAWDDWRCPEFQSRLRPNALIRNIQSWMGMVLDFMKFHVRLFEAAHTGRSALLKQKLVFGHCLETCECSELGQIIL
jgi:hypothetical protein